MHHWLEFGDPAGFPVLYCHGTPGSAAEGALADVAALRHGLRLIAPDRPGYGWAPEASEMGYTDWAKATSRFLTEIGIGHYGLLAVSGGAPSALALAALDGNRIAAMSLVCALGPIAESELAREAGRFVLWMLKRAEHNLDKLDRFSLQPLAALGHAVPLAIVKALQLISSPSDRHTLARQSVKRLLARNVQRACRQGSAGVKRDLYFMSRYWDFPLAEVTTVVKLMHGLDDHLLHPRHSQWLASHLPCAELTLVEHEGHFSLPIDHADTILEDLAKRCQ